MAMHSIQPAEIKATRLAWRASQAEFAKLVGISVRHLRNLERSVEAVEGLGPVLRDRLKEVLDLPADEAIAQLADKRAGSVAIGESSGMRLEGADPRAKALTDWSWLYSGRIPGESTVIPNGTKCFVLTTTDPLSGPESEQLTEFLASFLRNRPQSEWHYLFPSEECWSDQLDPSLVLPHKGVQDVEWLRAEARSELASIRTADERFRAVVQGEGPPNLGSRFVVRPVSLSHHFSPDAKRILLVFPRGGKSYRAWLELSFLGMKRLPAHIELRSDETRLLHDWLRFCGVDVSPKQP